ncbi:Hypothetical protein, putative [Bodo saltans]|uniref:Uncharacterized protein n=1 Tax=Bodo saltans TaxID=75058 RepID=A0A0S4JED4_BODSA|nr:Hypothetical protein, putative [Bodo saltans]|eukprot:CUG89842.1 Hypothetical protein, putative [Bodo saltans]
MEAKVRPLTMHVRALTSAIASPFSYSRVDALKKSIQLFLDWSVCGGTTAQGDPCDIVQSYFVPRSLQEKPPAPSWHLIQTALRNTNVASSVFHRTFPRRDLLFQPGAVQICDMTDEEALNWSTLVVPRRPPLPGAGPVATPPAALPTVTPSPGLFASSSTASPTTQAPLKFELFEPLRAVTLVEQELAMRFLQGVSNLVPGQKEFIGESPLLPLFAETMLCLKQHLDALWEQQQQQGIATSTFASSSALGLERNELSSAAVTLSGTTGAAAAGGGVGGASLFANSVPFRSAASVEASLFAGTVSSVVANRHAPVRLNPALEATIAAMIDAVESACHYQPRSLVVLVSSGALKAALHVALCSYAPRDIRCSLLDTLSVLLQEIAPFRRLVQAPPSFAGMQPSSPVPGSFGAAAGAAIPQSQAPQAPPRDSLTCMLDAARGGNVMSPLDLFVHGAGSPMLSSSMTITTLGVAGGGGHGGGAGAGAGGMLGGSGSGSQQPIPFGMDRASASKFDSAIRDVLSQRRLLGILPQLTSLRDVKGVSVSLSMPRAELHRLLHKGQREREKKLADIISHIDELQTAEGFLEGVGGGVLSHLHGTSALNYNNAAAATQHNSISPPPSILSATGSADPASSNSKLQATLIG